LAAVFAGGLIAAPVLTFAGLWGVPIWVRFRPGTSHAAVFTTPAARLRHLGPLLGALSDAWAAQAALSRRGASRTP